MTTDDRDDSARAQERASEKSAEPKLSPGPSTHVEPLDPSDTRGELHPSRFKE